MFSRGKATRVVVAASIVGVVGASLAIPAASGAAGYAATVKAVTVKTATAKSKTTTASTKVSTKSPPASTRPPTTLPPKPLSARTAVKNWASIADTDWPSIEGSITARAQARSIEVYRTPDDRTGVLAFIAGRSVAGPVHFLALGISGDWVRVAIPLRPNGTVGWVRRSDVLLIENSYRVVIELSTNRLSVFEGSRKLIEASVASGTGGTPTPTGLFFLKELVPQSPSGALGPYAFGLSGYSDVLTSFNGGEGVIGIHGTNAPGKLGSSVSHGCVRVDNVNITTMAKNLPLGTPVEIVRSLTDAPSIEFRKTTSWAFGSGASVPAGNPASVVVDAADASATTTSTTTTTISTGTTPTIVPVATTTTSPASS